MTIDRWIADTAAANPNQCAIEFNGEHLSYVAMTDAIDRKVNEPVSYTHLTLPTKA